MSDLIKKYHVDVELTEENCDEYVLVFDDGEVAYNQIRPNHTNGDRMTTVFPSVVDLDSMDHKNNRETVYKEDGSDIERPLLPKTIGKNTYMIIKSKACRRLDDMPEVIEILEDLFLWHRKYSKGGE